MIIAVDFDGTIVEHDYPKIGKPVPFAFDTLGRLIMEGHTLILWTVREGELLDEAVDFCRKNGIEFFAINSNQPVRHDHRPEARKITADLYIDDRNIGGLPDWGVIYQMIHSKEAYNPYPESENRYRSKKNIILRMGEFIEKIRTTGIPMTKN
jgi:hypothetical protein